MAKKSKAKTAARPFFTSHPWQYEARGSECALLAFVEKSSKWETVALVQKTPGASAKTVANYIAELVNDAHENGDMLQGALEVLEAVINEGLTFSTEHDVDIMIRRIKQHSVGKK
jgi:ribosomal protein L22